MRLLGRLTAEAESGPPCVPCEDLLALGASQASSWFLPSDPQVSLKDPLTSHTLPRTVLSS